MSHWPSTNPTLLRRLNDPCQREEAWREFSTLYGQPVYGLIRRGGVGEDDAEVLTQEVRIKVFRSLASYRAEGPFRAWLRRMVVRCVCDFWRSRRPDRASGDPDTADRLAQVPDPHWEHDWRDRLIHLACERVRLQQRQPLHWQAYCEFVLEGRSAKQIEASTGIGQGYVYVIKGRIQKQLREEMQRLMAEWGEGEDEP
jgi:RNA polymerase sigma-70 factor (ECF subfamily)